MSNKKIKLLFADLLVEGNVTNYTNVTEHSENRILLSSKTRSDLKRSSPAFNKHAFLCQTTKRESKHFALVTSSLGLYGILAERMFAERWIEQSRSDLVFEQSKLQINFIFRMLYWKPDLCSQNKLI